MKIPQRLVTGLHCYFYFINNNYGFYWMLLFQGTQSVCKSFIFSLMPSLRHSQESDHFITIKKREISRDASTGKGNWSWIRCKILLLPFPKPPSPQPLPLWQNWDLLKGKLGYSFPLFVLLLESLSGLSHQPSPTPLSSLRRLHWTSCQELGTPESSSCEGHV